MNGLSRWASRRWPVDRRKILLAAVLAAVLPACSPRPGEVAGRVSFRGDLMEGISVEVYLEARRGEGGRPFAAVETGPGGSFSLLLPAGDYYLWAKEAVPEFGPRKIAEYAGNPVRVKAGARTELDEFELLPVGLSDAEAVPPDTGLTGRIVIDGETAEDAVVMVYRLDRERLTGPGYAASARSGPDGRFRIDLAPGGYRVAARQRRDGSPAGFLREGDYSAEYEGNPVTVEEGRYLDLGTVALHRIDRRELAAREESRLRGESPTRVEGQVKDGEGKPLAGQYVFVYRDGGMIGRPDMMAVSGADGSFVFDLPGGGTYYLGARSSVGGPRQPGELVGRLDGSADSAVRVGEGEAASGLIIEMEEAW